MKKVLRYGISLRKVKDYIITSFSDTDWGGDHRNRKSQRGYLIYIGDSLVAWTSNKQSTLTRSSTNVEYKALAAAVEKIEAVNTLLEELGVQVPMPDDKNGAS